MKKILFVLGLIFYSTFACAQDFEINRNHKTPLFQVFKPSGIENDWVTPENEGSIPSTLWFEA